MNKKLSTFGFFLRNIYKALGLAALMIAAEWAIYLICARDHFGMAYLAEECRLWIVPALGSLLLPFICAGPKQSGTMMSERISLLALSEREAFFVHWISAFVLCSVVWLLHSLSVVLMALHFASSVGGYGLSGVFNDFLSSSFLHQCLPFADGPCVLTWLLLFLASSVSAAYVFCKRCRGGGFSIFPAVSALSFALFWANNRLGYYGLDGYVYWSGRFFGSSDVKPFIFSCAVIFLCLFISAVISSGEKEADEQ